MAPAPISPTPNAIHQARQLFHQGKAEQAAEVLRRFLQRNPTHAEANHSLAVIFLNAGQREQALYHARRAVSANDTDPEYRATLASIADALGDRAAALTSARKAAELAAGSASALIDLIPLFWGMAEFDDALLAAEAAMRMDRTAARGPMAQVLLHIGEVEKAAAFLRSELAQDPEAPDVLLPLVQALNYLPGIDPQESFELHQRLGGSYSRFARPERPARDRDPDRRLRIGLISPDYFSTSVAFFAEPIIEHLDRSRFEVYCYSSGSRSDAVTTRLQGLADAWRNIASMSLAAALEHLDADHIDILIDLAGHTTGNSLPLLAAKPAPIQVTAIGYPNTTGLPQVDYRMVDAVTDTPDSMATEALLRLPGCFLCYRPIDGAPEPRRLAGSGITFGSFNVVQKLSNPVIDVWTRLVNAVPGSRMVLKASQFATPSIRERVARRFHAAGLEPSRLELLPPIPSKIEHLAAYNRIDVALDPFPYNGTTTTCEALHMGVPVVTLEGTMHAGRVGSSLLRGAGLPEFIARTIDDYIGVATRLAADASVRMSLRAGLRRRLLESSLCDGPAYGIKVGTALRGMWRDSCSRNQ